MMRVYFLAVLLGVLLCSGISSARTITVYPEISNISTVPVSNYNKGWTPYCGGGHFEITGLASQCYNVLYLRIDWGYLEGEGENNFDWSIIDNQLAAVRRQGKRLALRVMALDVHSDLEYEFPKWVIDGAPEDFTSQAIEVDGERSVKWYPLNPNTSARWKYACKHLADALGARYNNNPDIAFIDVGTIGIWGEQQSIYFDANQNLTEANWREHVGWYLHAFPNKPVLNCVMSGDYEWADTQGMGRRTDGFMADSADPLHNAYDSGAVCFPAYQWRTVSAFEQPGKFTYMAQKNNYRWGYFWNGIINVGKPTYVNWDWYKRDLNAWQTDYPYRMIEAHNRMGYHLVLTEASYPDDLTNGQPGTLTLRWRNDGCRYPDYPLHVACALLDDANNVLQQVWCDTIDLRENCAPWVKYHVDNLMSGRFDLSELKEYVASSAIDFDRNPKATHLAIGVFADKRATNPDIAIGNTGKLNTGWYVLDQYAPKPQSDRYPSLHAQNYRKPVHVSSTSSGAAGNIVDGDVNTNWAAPRAAGSWCSFDLGKARNFSMVWLDWNTAYPTRYTIQKSDDNATWTDIVTVKDSDGGFDYVVVPETRARYVRILGQDGSGFDLWECEVLGSSELQVAQPSMSPEPSMLSDTSSVSVSLTSSTPGAAIRYTTDGTDPTASHGTMYRAPVTITTTSRLKAIAYKEGSPDSFIADGVYTLSRATGLKGEYFDNLTLSGPPQLTRIDSAVDFHGNYAPVFTGVNANGISIRWTGFVQPEYTETYSFHITSRGGVRLLVNGKPLIDRWKNQNVTEQRGSIALTAGKLYPITLEYRRTAGNIAVALSWSSKHQPKQVIPQTNLCALTQSPYTVHNIPGVVEAEDYDRGDDGYAYHDTTLGNHDGAYRTDNVDVADKPNASNGYSVGWCENGEWLEYTLNTVAAGTYDITVRYACAATPGTLRVKLGDGHNGENFVTIGTFTAIQNQGNWGNFYTTTLNNVPIAGGTGKILRLEHGGNFDIDSITFTQLSPTVAANQAPVQ